MCIERKVLGQIIRLQPPIHDSAKAVFFFFFTKCALRAIVVCGST